MVYVPYDFKEGITKKNVDPLMPATPKKAPPPLDRSNPTFAPKYADHLLVYTLELSDNGSPDYAKRYVRLPAPFKPYMLRFKVVAGSLALNKGVFYTNYPIDGSEFGREKFHAVSFSKDFSIDSFCDIRVVRSGAYEYYVKYNTLPVLHPATPSTPHLTERVESDHGYFVIDPKLTVKTPKRVGSEVPLISKDVVPLPIDGLVIESVVSKWLGPFPDWDPQIKAIADRGYNMIHFVPIQKRGISNSPYSIFDQHQFADDLFTESQRALPDAKKYEIVKCELAKVKEEHGVTLLSDVVWNHTSCDSKWLWEHPEAGYNIDNSPHLTAALELDTALLKFSAEMGTIHGLPTTLADTKDLDLVMDALKDKVFTPLCLWEFYVINVKESIAELRSALTNENVDWDPKPFEDVRLREHTLKEQAELFNARVLTQFGITGRYGKKVKIEIALAFLFNLANVAGYDNVHKRNIEALVGLYQQVLDKVNLPFYKNYDEDVLAALNNIRNRVEYQRLAAHGPKLGVIDEKHPLIETYFTRLPINDTTKALPKSKLALANNGWLWNTDPLKDFAGPNSHACLRREVIIWGDCVKLRYGKGPDDNKWLWDHMRRYTETTARLFQGIRIDNCHSTPIHVAQYLLDAARVISPDLYVVAELFTGNEDTDITFVSQLGINSVIREAMQAWDPRELSHIVHRHGGKPVGSMDADCLTEEISYQIPDGALVPALTVPLQGSQPHALFMDCTHDNETPNQKRTPEDTLATAALVAFSGCAIGSVKGYDEIYPELLDIVNESRLYERPDKPSEAGISRVKTVLQRLHVEMMVDGYIESHIHQEGDYIIVHRQDPVSHQGYVLIVHTAFPGTTSQRGAISPISLRGTEVGFMFSAQLVVKSRSIDKDPTWLRGLPSVIEPLGAPSMRRLRDAKGPYTEVVVPPNFPSGSIMLLKKWIPHNVEDIDEFVTTGIEKTLTDLGLLEMNIILYRCNEEERDVTPGNGTYNVPGHGDLVYCGLEGFMSVLRPIIQNNDLGHPLCDHLREGQWALDYVADRLGRHVEFFPKLEPLYNWFKSRHDAVKTLPNFLLPKYFALIQTTAYNAVRHHTISLMSPFVRDGDLFTQSLALCSVQMYGISRSTGLQPDNSVPSLAAGLPHFSHNHMRTWGRDVFISLRGLFLTTGNFEAAKAHLVSFASSLKHGLIPNLLDAVRSPRYNARDAVWWFMQSLQDYCTLAPEGTALLETPVKRRFPLDDTWVPVDDPCAYAHTSTIAEIIFEILQRHAQGIHFREYNAGPNLDSQMTDAGFNVDVSVDWGTGFVYGGNQWNCGTWMDKMGESAKAGNKGVPATPRDGADVEIVGLLKSSLRWVIELNAAGKFPWVGVKANVYGSKKEMPFKEWDALVQKSFEKYFYIPKDEAEYSNYIINPKLVSRRGSYKDVYKCSKEYSDYELRPNFPIAMVVAPELFDSEHALGALQLAYDKLAGPLGMRTLDPDDWAYRPNYDNSNDGDDRAIAKGWNYHQGPEWVWCIGYFLRAYLHFDVEVNCNSKKANAKLLPDAMLHIHRLLLAHKKEILKNKWAGLPELTNKDGAVCWDGCPTQAWSASTLLDLLENMVQRYNVHVRQT